MGSYTVKLRTPTTVAKQLNLHDLRRSDFFGCRFEKVTLFKPSKRIPHHACSGLQACRGNGNVAEKLR